MSKEERGYTERYPIPPPPRAKTGPPLEKKGALPMIRISPPAHNPTFGASRRARQKETPGPTEREYIQPDTGRRMIETDATRIETLDFWTTRIRSLKDSSDKHDEELRQQAQGYYTTAARGFSLHARGPRRRALTIRKFQNGSIRLRPDQRPPKG